MQFGFRPNHSTSHALLALTDYFYESIHNGHVCIVVSLDIKKCFDSIVRYILIEKLKWYNVNSGLLKSYLNNRKQFVSVKQNIPGLQSEPQNIYLNSNFTETTTGIPQGASLSSLLFIILINDLPDNVKDSLTILFADDTQLTISGPLESILLLKNKIEKDLSNVSNWMYNNRLELSDEKALCMYIGSPNILSKLQDLIILMNNKPIKCVDSIRILGIVIDNKLEWTTQTKLINQKCHSILTTLFPLRNVLSLDSKTILVSAYVIPILNYAACVWLNTSKANYKEYNKIVKRCVRFIFRKRYFDNVDIEISDKLKWLKAKYKYKFEVLKLAYSTVNNIAPEYYQNYLSFENFSQRITRNSCINYNIVNNNKSFKNNATKMWLDLPNDFKKDTLSYKQFKQKTYEYLLKQQSDEINHKNNLYQTCIDNVLAMYQ
jgi:hypothetical protein